ncbi:hypothetical protein ACFTXV_25060, partial [Streptomyces harbinensis]
PETGSWAAEVTGAIDALGKVVTEQITGLRQELLQPAEPDHEEGPEAAPDAPPRATEEHGRLLQEAARISRAELVCHRDTWDFIVGRADGHPHFRTPAELAVDQDERVTAAVSGRSLIAALITLWETQHAASPASAEWALATSLYARIQDGLSKLAREGSTVRIALDDRAPTAAPPPGLEDAGAPESEVGSDRAEPATEGPAAEESPDTGSVATVDPDTAGPGTGREGDESDE